jgi:assimilatory nitrate reductase catalytic subunit
MTRTGLSPRLGGHRPEPFLTISPSDADVAGLQEGNFVRLTSIHGSCVMRANVSTGQKAGTVFAPIHWSDATARHARVGALIAPEVDALSGQPELKATPVRVERITYGLRGFALTRERLTLADDDWFARAAVADGHGLLFASNASADAWRTQARAWLSGGGELVEFDDLSTGVYRVAELREGRLEGCVFMGPAETAPVWDVVKALFEADELSQSARRLLLSGRANDGLAEQGPLVCACFGVGATAIQAALDEATTVEDLGRTLKAGTNCGSCLPEIKRMLAHARIPQTI